MASAIYCKYSDVNFNNLDSGVYDFMIMDVVGDQTRRLVLKAVQADALDASSCLESSSLNSVGQFKDGIQEVRILLIARDEGVAFETSNLLLDARHCIVSLKSATLEPFQYCKNPENNMKNKYLPDLIDLSE